jgi:2-polyprenyl-3-methyl-5-hydroxy-6-metoxy-1,4-benzoquinol methylase
MKQTTPQPLAPQEHELQALLRSKYGDVSTTGWRPRMRHRFGYYTPDDYYEAIVDRAVGTHTQWLDVGCGRELFPSNKPLARRLAERCQVLVGLDPDGTLYENPYVHERVKSTLQNYRTQQTFDLITLRMVAEHLTEPRAAVSALARLTKPGGKVIVYTVCKWSPVSVLSYLVPFALHHPCKRLLWQTEAKDTFPVAYQMNTRRSLTRLFATAGFCEHTFYYLDDCRTLARFRPLHFLELLTYKSLQLLHVRYPEVCLLGVYERMP